MKIISRIAVLSAALVLTACAYPTRNLPLENSDPAYGYRWSSLAPDDMPETLVIVSASGGGTRAAVLALSVLEGLDTVALPNGKTLANEVDVISSVSGGSVTAGYFAANGPAGFPKLEAYLRQDGMADLAWRYLNPVGLARLSTPSYERIDPLIDRLDENLFAGATFENLKGRRPFLILNASDMVEGIPFPLTQANFDLICSDLSKLKLSTGVAASAAFPIAMSAVTLTNYSKCPTQSAMRFDWAEQATQNPKDWYLNSERVAQGRVAQAYLAGRAGERPKLYIHLLDGGISDNLGIAEPYRMLTSTDVTPSFLNAIGNGGIKRIIFVMVNARSASKSALDQEQATPGMLDMLMGTVNASIDRASLGATERLKLHLQTELASLASRAENRAKELEAKPGTPPAVVEGFRQVAQRYRAVSDATRFVSVDFDAIEDISCRGAFHSIATSWSMPKTQIDAVLQMGQALLAAHPAFQTAITDLGGKPRHAPPSIAEACRTIGSTQ